MFPNRLRGAQSGIATRTDLASFRDQSALLGAVVVLDDSVEI